MREAEGYRDKIEDMAESDDVREKTRLLREADLAVEDARLIGDALAAAFFRAEKPKDREKARVQIEGVVQQWLGSVRQ